MHLSRLRRLLRLHRTTALVVLLGLLGLALSFSFVAWEVRGMEDRWEEDFERGFERDLAATSDWLSFAVQDALQGAEPLLARGGDSGEARRVILSVRSRLERSLLARPEVRGVSIRRGGDHEPITLGSFDPALPPRAEGAWRDPLTGWAVLATSVPPGPDAEPLLSVSIQCAPPPSWRSREDLWGSLLFALVAASLTLYLVAAGSFFVRGTEARLRQRSRERTQRLHALGDVARGIAHEVRNPLNAINLLTQVLTRSVERGIPPRAEDSARIHTEVRRIQHVVDRFAEVARIRDLAWGPLNLLELLEELAATRSAEFQEAGIEVRHEVQGSPELEGDAARLRDVFAALIDNAVEAIHAGGAKRGRIDARIEGLRRSVRIEIADDGDGVAADSAAKLFEPFYSTRERGLGLGLTLARILVEAHAGSIELSPATEGCRVRVVLPRKRPQITPV